MESISVSGLGEGTPQSGWGGIRASGSIFENFRLLDLPAHSQYCDLIIPSSNMRTVVKSNINELSRTMCQRKNMKVHFIAASALVCTLSFLTPVNAEENEIQVPPGYELQTLPGLDGRVLRPKGWYFKYEGTENSIIYRITKEDPERGYMTGFAITVAPSVFSLTKKKPSEYAQGVLAGYEREKVISRDEVRKYPSGQGEVEQRGYVVEQVIKYQDKEVLCRVGVSTIAIDNIDLLAVIVFGAPITEWSDNEEIYRTVCREIMLVGPNLGEKEE